MTDAPFELAVERYIDAPPAAVFKVWTERLKEWWAPKPFTTKLIERDLRPGGTILDVAPNERIVLTDAFAAGWNSAKGLHGGRLRR